MQTERAFRRPGHNEIGNVGGQNACRQFEGAESDSQREADPAPASIGKSRAIRQRHHDRHQQGDPSHVGRHDKGEAVGQQDDPADHAQPGA